MSVVGVPCAEAARDLGAPMAKNVVALGALPETAALFPAESVRAAIRQALGGKASLAELNERAFARGRELAATERAAAR